jgi:rod shape-determining protein MreC
MQKRKSSFSIFIVFFVVSLIIFGLSKTGIFNTPSSLIASVFSPVQSRFLNFIVGANWSSNSNLKDENIKLTKELSDYQKLKEQNRSLLDQFQSINPKSTTLLPANIIGAPSFIPGLSMPESFILDKGSSDGIKAGDGVVFKDNLVGKIGKITNNSSEVLLTANEKSSFTAKTGDNGQVLGVLKGQGGGEIIIDNVLLSENIKNGDFVFTNGNVNLNGEGFPPGLIVGKIISVEKNPSALFQKAEVKPLIDFTKLTMVFIILGK